MSRTLLVAAWTQKWAKNKMSPHFGSSSTGSPISTVCRSCDSSPHVFVFFGGGFCQCANGFVGSGPRDCSPAVFFNVVEIDDGVDDKWAGECFVHFGFYATVKMRPLPRPFFI